MPILTVELAILLAAAFAAGAVASWLAQDRRARSEHRRFELETQRVIDARRESYEVLERQVRALASHEYASHEHASHARECADLAAPLPAREGAER
ncbi:MAG: hypothetical protein FJ298_03260 [Planctomycetes bacterium]|nr:hypothetical protein [Planctomycetota bacterium]